MLENKHKFSAADKIFLQKSQATQLIDSIPRLGVICASELAGEVSNIGRFTSDCSLALYLYLRTANLDYSSGKFRGSKAPKHVNKRHNGRCRQASKMRTWITLLLWEKNELRKNRIIKQFEHLADSFTALYSEWWNKIVPMRCALKSTIYLKIPTGCSVLE